MVMKPVTHQARISRPGEFASRAISADTMKMPEPIMEPMTSVVALVKPRPFTSSELAAGAVVAGPEAGRTSAGVDMSSMFYPKTRRNSSTAFTGDSHKSDITATESAPASLT
jgi:hypothetical protein